MKREESLIFRDGEMSGESSRRSLLIRLFGLGKMIVGVVGLEGGAEIATQAGILERGGHNNLLVHAEAGGGLALAIAGSLLNVSGVFQAFSGKQYNLLPTEKKK